MEPKKPNDPEYLGKWRITGRLGEGGFGTVYLAESGAQKAAIKVVREDSGRDLDDQERFKLELTTLSKLVDPYIARVVDSDLEDPMPWFATEFVNGPTLDTKVKYEGPLGEVSWFNLAANLFHALVTSHENGVVHKDIKPSNIILGETGNKLIDFGIAHVSGLSKTANIGDRAGSLPFSSPDHFTTKSTPAMDIFSAAATLAYAATGKIIWVGDNELQLMRSINEDEPNLEGLSVRQIQFISPMLNKNPSDRPTSNASYFQALKFLEAITGETPIDALSSWSVAQTETDPRFKKFKPVAISVSLLLITAALLWQTGILDQAKSTASTKAPSASLGIPVTKTSISPSSSKTAVVLGTPDATSSIGTSTKAEGATAEIQGYLEKANTLYYENRLEEAKKYSLLAAKAGNAHGMYQVGYILNDQGKVFDAITWLTKAADAKYGDSYLVLGSIYSKQKNTAKAIYWWQKGADFGNTASMWNLGLEFEDQNQTAKAEKLYLQAASLGHINSMFNLGLILDKRGETSKAIEWYVKALDGGQTAAAVNLAVIYEEKSDWTKAKNYYEQAAKAGDVDGMYGYAFTLQNHFGDLVNACLWYGKAADKGETRSKSLFAKYCGSSMPKPLASSSDLKESPPLASNVIMDSIWGRTFLSGLDWLIPVTNSNTEVVPPLNGVQFRLVGYPNAAWFNIPYQLKNSDYGVRAQVDNLLIGILFKREVCPEFRLVQEKDGEIIHVWVKDQPECADNYVP